MDSPPSSGRLVVVKVSTSLVTSRLDLPLQVLVMASLRISALFWIVVTLRNRSAWRRG